MPESTRLVDLVQVAIDDFLDHQRPRLDGIGGELAPFADFSRDLLRGGKRFRALFCYWGWQAVGGRPSSSDPFAEAPSLAEFPAVVKVASALEIFHAAALVHDDIMDNSDTRRGMPATHKRFETLHSSKHWTGEPSGFGHSSALLLGDLLLGWSDELLDLGLGLVSDSASRAAARREFSTMRTEVIFGQYLDLLEERAWRSVPDESQLARASRVIVYKTAKYSVEAPLTIGAALGSASLEQVTALREFGLPLGVAYQLRDDLLGVFGDPATTGKPAGDDLREGKRTVLIALARTAMPSNARSLLDELLGDRDLDLDQVSVLRASIRQSGAVESIEQLIDENLRRAIDAIADAPISSSARSELIALADTVTRRTA
ncbi:polyprenyl synthetase family protein [soil metagenome]